MTRRGKAKGRRPQDALAAATKTLHLDGLAPRESKSTGINLRVSQREKEEIRKLAEKLGLSVSEYLLQLHRHALPRLASSK